MSDCDITRTCEKSCARDQLSFIAETHSDSETTSLHGSVLTSDRGYTSDSELYDPHAAANPNDDITQVFLHDLCICRKSSANDLKDV